MRIAIVGATSVIAQECASLWARLDCVELILIGRSKSRLEKTVAYLRLANPEAKIQVMDADLIAPISIQKTVDELFEGGSISIALIAQGSMPIQKSCQNDLHSCYESFNINAASPIMYAETFAKHMELAGSGTIAVIGSISGDRGRKSNYIYGSAKGMVTRYVEGLQHRFANSNINVILIKPGPTDTPMTAYLEKKYLRLESPKKIAKIIVSGISNKQKIIYAPKRWRAIMWVVQHIPRFIFNKLDL